MRFYNYINEREIFGDAPEEIAKHFKNSYGKSAINKIKYWIEKYRNQMERAGESLYSKELNIKVNNLTKALNFI